MYPWNFNKVLRKGSLALAALLMMGTLTEALHYALVPHQFCEAHGELEHGHAHALTEHGLGFSAPDAAQHEHPSCGVALLQRKRGSALSVAQATPSVVFSPVAPQLFLFSEVVVLSLTALDRAPKNSPPSLLTA